MNLHFYKNIEKYVELEAQKYAEFVGGVVEKTSSGSYCVSSGLENAYFDSQYICTKKEYVPFRCEYPMYAVTAHIFAYVPGKGRENIKIIL